MAIKYAKKSVATKPPPRRRILSPTKNFNNFSDYQIVHRVVASKLKNTNQAIILYNVMFWCLHNGFRKSKIHYKNGRYWTFDSIANFKRNRFPWLKESTIQTALDKLCERGLLTKEIIGTHHNDNRKYWYSANFTTIDRFLNERYSTFIYEVYILKSRKV